MESDRSRSKYRSGFSYDLDPCEREALSNILEAELDNSVNALEKKLQQAWDCF
ncbi:MAG: hypothetical protein ACMUHM_01400 [Thermoplasmatota archaeon]